MKSFPKKSYHELFRISIMVKAVDGAIESIAGLLIYFSTYTSVNRFLFSAFREETAENPHDAFWGYIIKEWHTLFLPLRAFWGILFLAHGIAKLFLSVMLLKNKLWAYPVAAVVFALFMIYEGYTFIYAPSVFLGIIGIFDAIVVGLIIKEYRYAKKNPRS